MQEREYYLAFSFSPLGPKRFLYLLDLLKTAENAWQSTQDELASVGIVAKTFEKFDTFRQHFEYSNIRNELEQKCITYLSQIDSLYPKGLLELDSPPIGLFVKGNPESLAINPKIAIVGSRKMTAYGQEVTRMFAESLTGAGFTVVSGMALGVDAIAHRAALEAKGSTIAILGNGVDFPYPRENMQLYQRIIDSGGAVVSEYPPGTLPNKGSFLARNRIIAALSIATLVTEAGEASGSLVTAQYAQNLNRHVFAVPGPITSSQSAGTAKLLKQEAEIVSHPTDILKVFELSFVEKKRAVDMDSLTEGEQTVMKLLIQEAYSLDTLSTKCGIPISQLTQIVTGLELMGYVKDNGQGKFIAVSI